MSTQDVQIANTQDTGLLFSTSRLVLAIILVIFDLLIFGRIHRREVLSIRDGEREGDGSGEFRNPQTDSESQQPSTTSQQAGSIDDVSSIHPSQTKLPFDYPLHESHSPDKRPGRHSPESPPTPWQPDPDLLSTPSDILNLPDPRSWPRPTVSSGGRVALHNRCRERAMIEYYEESRRGPDYMPVFTYGVRVNGTTWGTGSGLTKAEAIDAAARAAIQHGDATRAFESL